MKKFVCCILLLVVAQASGQGVNKTAPSAADLVPPGYYIFNRTAGDLNKDNQPDEVFVIQSTDSQNIVKNDAGVEVDRNRRGIIIALKKGNLYHLALANLSCFSSDMEDGGVYFPPDMSVSVEKGILTIHYAHGRYGYWTYKFRYQNADFELIGYDSSSNHGPIVKREISINLLTKKMLTRVNTNPYGESGEEKFESMWQRFKLAQPIRLSAILAFDELRLVSMLGLGDE